MITMKGETLQTIRQLLDLKQADVARHIRRYDGRGCIDDTTLSRIERCYLEPTDAFVWDYMEALIEATAEKAERAREAAEAMAEGVPA